LAPVVFFYVYIKSGGLYYETFLYTRRLRSLFF
jgi:hypothetical protein